MHRAHNNNSNTPAMSTLDDARGVVTGPMWARDEAARGNGTALVRSLRMGAIAALLVLLAYVAAAWLDEARSAELAQAAATVTEVA